MFILLKKKVFKVNIRQKVRKLRCNKGSVIGRHFSIVLFAHKIGDMFA